MSQSFFKQDGVRVGLSTFRLEEWRDCWRCGGSGYLEHDCGEDTCCCMDPDDIECDLCHGEGGWYS